MASKQAVALALATPDLDVPEQSRRSESSFAVLVSNLDVGEIACRTIALDPDMLMSEYEAALPALRVNARNNAAPAVKRAKAEIPGADYRVEITEVILRAGAAMVTCVTRVR